MWLEEAEELLKGYLPFYVLLVLPVFIMVSPVRPVTASYECPAYRMQHFDLHGVAHGCRSAGINLEAKSLSSWSTQRHCVVTKMKDLTVEYFRNIRTKAGALLVVLPQNYTLLTSEEKQSFLQVENMMLSQEVSIPVYFTEWSPELDSIITEVSTEVTTPNAGSSVKAQGTAWDALVSSVAANGYQIVVSGGPAKVRNDAKIATIQGHLPGYGASDGKIPTIAIVAHYDSMGIAPDLSFGSDANGSGVTILLELARLFSTLYSDYRTRGKYNIVFLLTGGGKMNFQGSKKWLEDQLDSLDGSIIQEASYVICLDTLAASDTLYMHVSKPPKEGTPPFLLYRELKASSDRYSPATVDGVHKKINLAEDLLAWEHERYSIRRLSAFTISTVKNYRDPIRGTVLDRKENLDTGRLIRHGRVIAEALLAHVYNISGVGDLLGGTQVISPDAVNAWLGHLSSQPRSPQLLSTKDCPIVQLFKETLEKYLQDIRVTYAVPDKRDPDFQFYDTTKGTLNIYSVKPAVFDLVLTIAITAYLGIFYLVIQQFSVLYTSACNLTSNDKKLKVK